MPVIEQKTTNKNKVDFDLNRLDKSKTTIFSKYPNFGSLILHYEDGQVVGYYLWSRAFGDLKTDNTFYTSSGAFDHGYSRIDFSAFDDTADAPNNTIIHPVCYCSSSAGYDENGELIEKYYNDGIEITAEEFEQEQERQFAKEDVQWIEFTSDNINNSIKLYQ